MDDARIRQILGLAEGAEITAEHRAQALIKLDELLTDANRQLGEAQAQVVQLTESRTGTVQLTEAQHRELVDGAAAGKEAQKQLAEMRADEALRRAVDVEHRALSEEAKSTLRPILISNHAEGLKLLSTYPQLPGQMFTAGGADDPGADSKATTERVQAFIDSERASKKLSEVEAIVAARKKFSAAEMDAWEYRPRPGVAA